MENWTFRSQLEDQSALLCYHCLGAHWLNATISYCRSHWTKAVRPDGALANLLAAAANCPLPTAHCPRPLSHRSTHGWVGSRHNPRWKSFAQGIVLRENLEWAEYTLEYKWAPLRRVCTNVHKQLRDRVGESACRRATAPRGNKAISRLNSFVWLWTDI